MCPRRRAGSAVGSPSVCSVHPLVIKAAVLRALDDDAPLPAEATSNQIDRFGGYTGMQPSDFRDRPEVEGHAAQSRLLTNLAVCDIPMPLISAHLPERYDRVRRAELTTDPAALAVDRVRGVLRVYARAAAPRACEGRR